MNENPSGRSATVQLFEPASEQIYTIEAVVHITQTPRHVIGVYCRHGLISPITPPEQDGWRFDDEAIRELRRIERLRTEFALELPALRMIVEMGRQIDCLRNELRSMRGR